MRQIKASEVKPGMTVKFDMDGWHVEGTVSRVEPVTFGLEFYSTQGVEMTLGEDTPVTVLAEPQPEEPVTLCARIVVAGRKIYRWTEDPKEPWPWRGEALNGDPVLWSWGQLCGLGHVTVIDAEPSWTAPEQTHDTPEVPERIEEWPEDDEHLRAYRWRDPDGYIWRCVDGWWRWGRGPWGDCHKLFGGPWDRVTDA